MDRRSFVQAGLSSLLTYTCSFARARAATTLHGCRMASSGGSFGVTLLEQNKIPQAKLTDLSVIAFSTTLRFGLRPGIGFYDDTDAPNALADPRVIFPNGPDGSVLMGIKLFDQIVPEEVGHFTNRKPGKVGLHTLGPHPLPTIIAHEVGHIMQYKRGMSPAGPWQMEPHADFLAGWCLGHGNQRPDESGRPKGSWTPYALERHAAQIEEVIKAFFRLGDIEFNNPSHHGEPEFRAAMVRAGYESGQDLDVDKAFEKGKKFAGLN